MSVFQDAMNDWKARGFDERWAISEEVWNKITEEANVIMAERDKQQVISLELGCGLSTVLFGGDDKFDHLAIEFNGDWYRTKENQLPGWVQKLTVPNRYATHKQVLDSLFNVVEEENGFNRCDLLFVDGPCGDRSCIVPYVKRLMADTCCVIVDDVNGGGASSFAGAAVGFMLVALCEWIK